MLVSNDEGVDSFEEFVMTERLSFDLERSLLSLKERGMACVMRSAKVAVDFALAYNKQGDEHHE